ncbi:MAG: hypothetical protein GXO09_00580 [Crenarchaeota archaeon]|nr:hypothetical protein [Thermoproteota archaeon]
MIGEKKQYPVNMIKEREVRDIEEIVDIAELQPYLSIPKGYLAEAVAQIGIHKEVIRERT